MRSKAAGIKVKRGNMNKAERYREKENNRAESENDIKRKKEKDNKLGNISHY